MSSFNIEKLIQVCTNNELRINITYFSLSLSISLISNSNLSETFFHILLKVIIQKPNSTRIEFVRRFVNKVNSSQYQS